MSNLALKEKLKERSNQIIEMLLIDSENESIEDYLLDLQEIKKAKTFKEICDLQDRDYKEEILNLKQQLSGNYEKLFLSRNFRGWHRSMRQLWRC